MRGHSLGVTGVQFSKHYPLLYSISKDSTMRCWRAENFRCAGIYSGHRYPIWCMDESPTGLYAATGSKDFTVRLWCLEKELPFVTYVGHTQDVEVNFFYKTKRKTIQLQPSQPSPITSLELLTEMCLHFAFIACISVWLSIRMAITWQLVRRILRFVCGVSPAAN